MIVITGGAGFIGSNLVAGLEERGYHNLVVCDTLGQDDKWQNLRKRELAEFILPSSLFSFLDQNKDKIKIIFHLAAISPSTEKEADLIMENNFILSKKLWHWCSQYEVRFIYASSAATYGDGRQGFDDNKDLEALATLRPLNAYGWSKHIFDRSIARAVSLEQAAPPQWVGLKFFNVFGPNEYHKGGQRSVVAHIFFHITQSGKATLFKSHHPGYTHGGQLRDFIWVVDCIDAMLWFLEKPYISGIFNVGTGKARTFEDLARAIFDTIEKPVNIQYIDMPQHLQRQYQYFTQASTQRLRSVGYDKPFTSLEDGVRQYIQNYLSTSDPYR